MGAAPAMLTAGLLQTLCKSMKVSQSDTDRLRIMEAVKDVEPELLQKLPELEVQWLAATLWNRGCSHVKFGRPTQSVPLMKAAMQVQAWRPWGCCPAAGEARLYGPGIMSASCGPAHICEMQSCLQMMQEELDRLQSSMAD